jgi:heptosyltransferase-1
VTTGFASIRRDAFRKRRNLMLAYGSELASPLLRLLAGAATRGPRTKPGDWRRGLILSHTHIGDVLYRTSSLPVLRESLPRCEWSYATSAESAPVLANNPDIAEVMPVIEGENSWNLRPGGFRELASRGFDAVLCTNTLRHYPDLALALRLGIPNRVAFSGKGFTGLINHPVTLPFPSSYAGYFQHMVRTITGTHGDWPLRPRMYPSASDRATAGSVWSSLKLGGRPVVACSLRTRQARGNWPEQLLIAALTSARRRHDFDVVLCGAPSDASALGEISRALPFPSHVLAGRVDLPGFTAFLSRCSVLLTLDSGPRHLGNAAGIPVVFARNLSHSKVEAGRYCDTESDIAPDLEYLDDDEIAVAATTTSPEDVASVLLKRLSA